MARRRTIVLAAAAVVALGASASALSFGPLVRAAVQRRAARLGATLTIAEVRPTVSGVRLRGVDVVFADAPHVTAKGATIEISGGRLGPVEAVTISGVELAAKADLATLERELSAVRERARQAPSGAEKKAAPRLLVRDVSLSLDVGDVTVAASGLAADRAEGAVTVRVGKLLATTPLADLRASGATIELRGGDGGLKLAALRAGEASVTKKPTVTVAPPPAEPAPLSARLATLRHRADAVLAALAPHTTDDVIVSVERASVSVEDASGTVHVGPGAFSASLHEDALEVSYQSPKGDGGATPLGVTLVLPRTPDKELLIAIAGGPVSLATLGLHDKDQGLFDVANATVEAAGKARIAADGRHVELAFSGKARDVSLEHPKLARLPVKGLAFGFRLEGGLDTDLREIRLDTGELDVGAVHVEAAGTFVKRDKGFSLAGRLSVPLASCQGALDALPEGLAPHVHGMTMSGAFSVRSSVAFDSDKPDRSQIDLTLTNECRVLSAPKDVSIERVRGPFRRRVYAPDGARVEVDSGPGTPGWVPYAAISPFMEAAVLTCEDGGFLRHRGFDVEAIRNSLRENLRAGKFLRGASTISMQTAKNLWLDRDKTLGRKLEEAILTSYLEQSLTKPEIMEVYLNIIEYGPMVYGIGPAAGHYFRTGASNLSLGQALYLASILPNPKVQHFGGDGRMSAGWMGYIHRLMRGMGKRGLVTEADVEEGLSEWVVFGQPAPRRAPDAAEDGIRLSPLPDEPGARLSPPQR